MTTLDDYFRRLTHSLSHPQLRNWKARLEDSGTDATLEVFRPESMLGQSQAEMNVQFTKDGNLLPLETVPWDDDLNDGLIQLKVKATNPDQEAERFALGLRAAMRKAEREAGDGYFNSILVERIHDSDLPQFSEIAEVLKHVHTNRPHQGRSYHRIRELIDDAIGGRATELTNSLEYPEADAKQILVSALARYLDQRFSVSNRRWLGLL